MIVSLRLLPKSSDQTDEPFSSTNRFYYLQHTSSVLAIRKLEYSLRLKQSNTTITFPRQQNRRFPYYIKSPSPKDDFIFYSNILPIDIEHIPFNITVDANRGTYENVPRGPNYMHFIAHNALKAVDNDKQTCWRPKGLVKKGEFFAIDILRIQTNIVFLLTLGHSRKIQSSLNMQVSFDGIQWISHRSFQRISTNVHRMSNTTFYRLIIDSRKFPLELQSFRYVAFNAKRTLTEPFQVCDIQILNNSSITF